MSEDFKFYGDLVDSKAHGLPRSVRFSPAQMAMVAKLVESRQIPQLTDFSYVIRDSLHRGLEHYEQLIKDPEFKSGFVSLRRRLTHEAKAFAEAMECQQAERLVETYNALFSNAPDSQTKERLRSEVNDLADDFGRIASAVLIAGLRTHL